MRDILRHKRAIWIGIGGIFLLLGILTAIFLLSSSQNGYLILEGNEKLIHKTEEQKSKFVVGSGDIPQSIYGYQESGKTANQISNFVFEPMVYVSSSKEVELRLAKEISFGKDGKTADITLQEKTFSDGSTLTPQDVLDCYLQLNKPDSPYSEKEKFQVIEGMEAYQNGLASEITGLRVTGKHTLQITFTEASVYHLEALSAPVWKNLDNHPYPIGTGPYQIETVQESQKVILTANQFAKKNPFGYEQIQFVNLPLENLTKSIEKYEVDAVTVNGNSGYRMVKDAKYFDVYHFPSGNYSYLSFSPDGDELLRQAVGAIFDQDAFIQSVRNVTDSVDGYEAASGVTSSLKSGDTFWNLLKRGNASSLAKKLSKERDEEAIKFLCPDQTKARAFYKELAEQFERYDLKLEAVFVDNLEQAINSGVEYDLAFHFEMNQSPEQVIETDLFSSQEEYQSFAANCLFKDYSSLYSKLEEKAAKELRVFPVDAKDQYLAVSADCHNQDMIAYLMNE